MNNFEIYLYIRVHAPEYVYNMKIIISFATVKLMMKNFHVNLKIYVKVYSLPPILLDTF